MKSNWIALATIAMFSFSVLVTLINYLSKKGIPVPVTLFGIFIVGAVVSLFQIKQAGGFKGQINISFIALIIFMGLLAVLGNWAQFAAAEKAPNPGLAIAIVSLQAGVIAVIARVFFNAIMTPLQLVGLLISLSGVILISLGSR